jgi:hypothetical protein
MAKGKDIDKAYDKAMAAAKRGSVGVERRRRIAAAANVGRERRRGAHRGPKLSERSTREDVLGWLQWNDPNGSYTDELAKTEAGGPLAPYTFDMAWETLEEMVGL